MKKKELIRLDANVKYQDTKPLKEKIISVLLAEQPNEVGQMLAKAELPLSMFEGMSI
jgi:hypothetical protein